MRVIPVIDILGGVVVHAKKGERDKYQPIRSVLSSSTHPVELAKVFQREFGFEELYIADLDSIQGKGMSTEQVRGICEATSMQLMVDAGVNNLQDAKKQSEAGVSKIIIGTETLDDLTTLSLIVVKMGGDRIISSLDLRDGKVVSISPTLRMQPPASAAEILEGAGVSQLIVLELTRVGSKSGVDKSLVESIVDSVKIPVIAGGGIRDIKDLNELREIGVDGALVATSLHTGTITSRDLRLFLNTKSRPT